MKAEMLPDLPRKFAVRSIYWVLWWVLSICAEGVLPTKRITFGENTFFLSSLFFTVFHKCTAILCWCISKLPELFRPIFTLCFIQLFCCFSLFFNFFFFIIFWYYWGPSGKRCKNAPLGKLMLGDNLALERNRNAKCKCAQRVHSFKRTSTCTKKNEMLRKTQNSPSMSV